MQANEEERDKLQSLDPLKEYLKERKKSAMRFIVDAAKLIVGSIEEDTLAGYDWIIAMLKTANLQEIESEIEISKAVHYIKYKQIDKAIELFKGFEKKDKIMMARAANNISFLYFLENNYENAEKFADMAI